ncbi:MAG TPA: hypothetical protein VKT82_19055 [Ktedonobacterales bacterium]|nr:hypothetical protein [Ktedonobacterales bacterium]
MDTKVTDAVLPVSVEAGFYGELAETLQVLLAKGPVLTLALFVGEASGGAATDARRALKADMDDVAQLLLACFRRSDSIVRCGEASCAAILMNAEEDGALRAVLRFQRMLACCKPLAISLRVGIAASPAQAQEGQALLALALKPYLYILPASGEAQGMRPGMDTFAESKPALALSSSRGGAHEKVGKTGAHLKQVLALSPATTFSSEPGLRLLGGGVPAQPGETTTRARARALGVPYIAPPQHIPNSVLGLLSAEVMRQLHCLPLGRDRNALTVALADPTDRGTVQRLEQLTGLTIFPVMTDPDALEALARPVRARRASRVTTSSAGPSGG